MFLLSSVAHNIALAMTKQGFALRHRPSPLEHRVSVESTLSFEPKKQSDDEENEGGKRYSLVFPNPVGLAAGFDKDGEAIQDLLDMGFGSVEVGTITPKPQPGNPKPRMFRLVHDMGIINRYGFNSAGADVVEQNLKAFRKSQQDYQDHLNNKNEDNKSWQELLLARIFPAAKPAQGLLGINIGKNKTTEDAKADYVHNIQQLGSYADYMVINISSPNTPNLRDLQKASAISELVDACLEARDKLSRPVPLLVKLAPDLTDDELESMIPTLLKVDGIVVTNTTNQRLDTLLSIQHRDEAGGLSGAPLKDKSTQIIRKVYELTNGDVFIIGVGGIGSGEDAYEKIKAGASVVQVYSMMVYKGPGCVSRIRHDLADLMLQNGQRSLEDVIGRDHDDIFWRKRQERQKLFAQTGGVAQEPVIVTD
jgi:dihydroorotate dehydrogenase